MLLIYSEHVSSPQSVIFATFFFHLHQNIRTRKPQKRCCCTCTSIFHQTWKHVSCMESFTVKTSSSAFQEQLLFTAAAPKQFKSSKHFDKLCLWMVWYRPILMPKLWVRAWLCRGESNSKGCFPGGASCRPVGMSKETIRYCCILRIRKSTSLLLYLQGSLIYFKRSRSWL